MRTSWRAVPPSGISRNRTTFAEPALPRPLLIAEQHRTMTTETTEHRSFEADVSRLLHLMVHSVYSDREVFLRELSPTPPTPPRS